MESTRTVLFRLDPEDVGKSQSAGAFSTNAGMFATKSQKLAKLKRSVRLRSLFVSPARALPTETALLDLGTQSTAIRSSVAAAKSGECLLFLQSARNLPQSCQSPSVRAWAENPEGETVGIPAEWGARHGNQNPAWFSIQSLGFALGEHKDAIGRVNRPILDTLGFGVVTAELSLVPIKGGTIDLALKLAKSCATLGSIGKERSEDSSADPEAPPTISFQVIDAKAVKGQRTVFFIRHGESVWNKAQSEMNLRQMLKMRDHPLSELGMEQAEALSSRIKQCGNSNPIFKPDVIYVSPLTRAVQTAVISLQEVFRQPKNRKEVVLMASAREKQNFGGLDTKSTSTGKDIVQRSLKELRSIYKEDERALNVLAIYKQLRFDAQEVSSQWWHGDAKESAGQLEIRLNEFMSQLLYTPHQVLVVVGHSHFFREIFRRYLSMEFRCQNPEFVSALQRGKLMNCGVAMLQLDPDCNQTGPITSVKLVFNTELLPPKSRLRRWCCCCLCFCASRQRRQPRYVASETE